MQPINMNSPIAPHFCSFHCKWFCSCSKQKLVPLSLSLHNINRDSYMKCNQIFCTNTCNTGNTSLPTTQGSIKQSKKDNLVCFYNLFGKVALPVRHKPEATLSASSAAQLYLLDTDNGPRSGAIQGNPRENSGLGTVPRLSQGGRSRVGKAMPSAAQSPGRYLTPKSVMGWELCQRNGKTADAANRKWGKWGTLRVFLSLGQQLNYKYKHSYTDMALAFSKKMHTLLLCLLAYQL